MRQPCGANWREPALVPYETEVLRRHVLREEPAPTERAIGSLPLFKLCELEMVGDSGHTRGSDPIAVMS